MGLLIQNKLDAFVHAQIQILKIVQNYFSLLSMTLNFAHWPKMGLGKILLMLAKRAQEIVQIMLESLMECALYKANHFKTHARLILNAKKDLNAMEEFVLTNALT